MGLPGTTDSSIYQGLKDVLQRYPVVTTVTYEPDSIIKESLRAQIDPSRVVPPTGPQSPTLDVEWRFVENDPYYRIHYADSNTGFNCGWHRDDDHPELGPVHFQYHHSLRDEQHYERAQFEKTIPTEILWTALNRLFEHRIPTLTEEF
jgi:hypothetical protein